MVTWYNCQSQVVIWYIRHNTTEALLTLSLSILIRTLVSQASRHGFDSDNYFSEVGWIWLSLCLSLSVSLAPLLQGIGSSEASRDATSLAVNKLTDLRRNCECSPHRMQCPATFWSSFECSPELHPFQREKQMFLSWLFMFVTMFQYVWICELDAQIKRSFHFLAFFMSLAYSNKLQFGNAADSFWTFQNPDLSCPLTTSATRPMPKVWITELHWRTWISGLIWPGHETRLS